MGIGIGLVGGDLVGGSLGGGSSSGSLVGCGLGSGSGGAGGRIRVDVAGVGRETGRSHGRRPVAAPVGVVRTDVSGGMSVGIYERRRVGTGIQVTIERERVLGRPCHRVEAREGAESRVVAAGREVIQIGRACGGLEDPALEAPRHVD